MNDAAVRSNMGLRKEGATSNDLKLISVDVEEAIKMMCVSSAIEDETSLLERFTFSCRNETLTCPSGRQTD